ncbi:hypothetical protein DI09_11p120 [Mitosporidium daphniae]|uniref:Uncharacterized protein n=1 Tax=Mitosporidium daphniae TaxID=1485682 RepID=A0A098VVJ3_9MICR|nr:uncharacterized protein DI09_11p120 [Mitosporidium daphniae]KGG52967.1 hypothetical protein DI09_11p120 [Mitosporidium daphniae]|eukprot:XP_013239394.1 uncharacterized protein DI09_11p120 [Mitosporidium daphniae]
MGRDERIELEKIHAALSVELFSLRRDVNRLLDALIAKSGSTIQCSSPNQGHEEKEDLDYSSEDSLYETLYDSYAAGILRKDTRRRLSPLVPYPHSRHKVKVCPVSTHIGVAVRLGEPCVATVCTWSCFGKNDQTVIEHLKPYHTITSIYPPGFVSKRKFYNIREPSRRVYYLSTIEPGPLFKIYLQSDPTLKWASRHSTDDAFQQLISALASTTAISDSDWPIFTSGDDFFGLEHPVVRRQIEEMPGACFCIGYYRFAADPLTCTYP